MKLFISKLLLVLGVRQGAPPAQTGSVEGKVVRTSNSEPIPGVQIALVALAPPNSATGTTPTAPAVPTQMQVTQTPQGVQVNMTVGGVTTTQVLPPDGLAALQRSGAPLTPETSPLSYAPERCPTP